MCERLVTIGAESRRHADLVDTALRQVSAPDVTPVWRSHDMVEAYAAATHTPFHALGALVALEYLSTSTVSQTHAAALNSHLLSWRGTNFFTEYGDKFFKRGERILDAIERAMLGADHFEALADGSWRSCETYIVMLNAALTWTAPAPRPVDRPKERGPRADTFAAGADRLNPVGARPIIIPPTRD
ncbi:hypothetical protein L1787_01200 [Acuticoccus sp. M5D2P5]|uniref:hypothetical protein n=1 Tax=Acuticoccus kalidii TaxID=2910977 RepID=UPI001F2AF5D5|nr:hypothetical protein [Acuticoccus kalidii]MCF3932029.1 hypothetical protein [Acuticoccus kalidii]